MLSRIIFVFPGLSTASSTSTYILVLCMITLFLSNFLIYFYMKKQDLSAREINKIGSPCFDSYPNQYSSLPTKEDELKVKRQTSFSGISGLNSKPNSHGTLPKSNNLSGHNTPKVLSKCLVEFDTGSVKRNSNGLNNNRTMRRIDDDKF